MTAETHICRDDLATKWEEGDRTLHKTPAPTDTANADRKSPHSVFMSTLYVRVPLNHRYNRVQTPTRPLCGATHLVMGHPQIPTPTTAVVKEDKSTWSVAAAATAAATAVAALSHTHTTTCLPLSVMYTSCYHCE